MSDLTEHGNKESYNPAHSQLLTDAEDSMAIELRRAWRLYASTMVKTTRAGSNIDPVGSSSNESSSSAHFKVSLVENEAKKLISARKELQLILNSQEASLRGNAVELQAMCSSIQSEPAFTLTKKSRKTKEREEASHDLS